MDLLRMNRRTRLVVLLTIAAVLCATPAAAQENSKYPTVAIGGNFGFQKLNATGGLLELGFDIPVHLTEHFAIGPWVQVGFSQKTVNLIATANARWKFDFLERTRFDTVEPFIQGGLGVIYTKINGAKATDFVMNMGFGAEVPVSDHVYLGTDFMFHPILTRPTGGNWAFSWQFLTLRYRF